MAAVTALAFLPILQNGFVDFDDAEGLVVNTWIRGLGAANLRWMLTTFHLGHWQPLAWLSFALDYRLWGLDARGFHLSGLLLHAANAGLLAVLAERLLACADVPAGRRLAGAVAAALLWSVHPLRVESVAWATERRDVLSGLFYLLTLLTYLRLAEARRAGGGWRVWWLASVGCFALSLLSKAWGVTLPLVLLVLDVHPLRRLGRGGGLRTVLAEKVPYFVLALGGAALAHLASSQVPARRTLAQEGVVARAAQAAYGLVFYLWKTVVPVALSPAYLLEQTVRPTEPRYVLSAAVVLGLAAAVVRLRRRWPWAAAASACYFLVLVTVLGFVQTGPQIVADRYTYLACVPWAVLAAAGLDRLARHRAALALAAASLAVLGALTFRQTRVWHDSRTLWEHALAVDPDNYIAYQNRGTLRQARGDWVGAFGDYSEALRRNPIYSPAWYSRGTERLAWGDDAGAIADYTAAVRIKPTYIEAYNNRGLARQRTGDLAGAIADYQEALRLAPADWRPRGMIQGNLALAEQALARRTRE